MKKLFLSLVLGLVTTTFSIAQNNIEATYVCELKIDYEQTIQQVPQAYRSQVADMLKAEIDNGVFINYFLRNNGKLSEFKIEEKIANSQSQSGMIAQQMLQFDNKPTYKDFSVDPNMYYKEMDLMGKIYLIKDQVPDNKWKITREKSEIAGYKVTKAEGVMMDSIQVTAWYAPEIAIKDGPSTLAGLPGLIVKAEFEMNHTKMIYTLKDIKISDKELKMALPTKGNVVTQDQFMAEIKKLQDQYKDMMGSGVDTN